MATHGDGLRLSIHMKTKTPRMPTPYCGAGNAQCASRKHGRRAIRGYLIPGQGAARLVFDDTGLEKIAFFLQVDHLAHPGERIFFVGKQRL